LIHECLSKNQIERCYSAVSHAYDNWPLTVMATRSTIKATVTVTLLILMLFLTMMKTVKQQIFTMEIPVITHGRRFSLKICTVPVVIFANAL
jgi:hypothetical protein